MFCIRTSKVLSNLILLVFFCIGQVAAAPNNSNNKAESYSSSNSDEMQKTMHFLPATPAQTLSTEIVISQVYGVGGNSGTIYNNDYGGLFSRGTIAINMKRPTSTFASVLHIAPPTPVPTDLSTESTPEIACGETIMEDTTLTEDLGCPPDTEYAIIIGASNITLDLGGHTISGYTPKTGVFAIGQEGITIRNGTIEGFNAGVFIIETNLVTMENLTVRNLDISDPNHFLFGIQILGSQNVVVRDSLFEFLTVPHKEAVEIFDSYVDVSNIEVHGGGAGVSFSFAGGICDPVNSPSNGTVRDSRFSDIYIAGIWIACTSSALIEGNDFSGCQDCMMGIQGDAPFLGAVTGLTIKDNFIHDTFLGIEFRGITQSSILNNYVLDNEGWGIALRQSLGCLTPEPGWECFYSTTNLIADNWTWGNFIDLYHYEDSLGNIWERNMCVTKDGAEIPECTSFVKSIVRANVSPSSAASVNFTVTFSEPVTGVDTVAPINDFDLTTSPEITGAFVTGVTSISGTTYTVNVNTGLGNGTIRLNVVDDNSIVDAASNPLGGAAVGDGDFTNGQIYTVIKSATFADVPLSYWSNTSIERLYIAGITGGCTTVPLNYCPTTPVTRAQMAIFLLRGIHGSTYTPPAATGTRFNDVPLGTFGAAWIEQLATEGITSGCGGGNYCPNQAVSRAQMAIFLVRAKHGSTFVPPTATGIFADVPIGSFGANFIEQLVADAITSGCGSNNYCPNTMVKRDSMAVFLVKTFNLP